MIMKIEKARPEDIPAITALLGQVLEVHAKLRPDIFISGTVKYTPDELLRITADEKTPVFVAKDDGGKTLGHLFGKFEETDRGNIHPHRTFYIDDICVDESARGRGVATALYEFAVCFAKENGCYNITLNVWEGNAAAKAFYEKMGMFVRETQMEQIIC